MDKDIGVSMYYDILKNEKRQIEHFKKIVAAAKEAAQYAEDEMFDRNPDKSRGDLAREVNFLYLQHRRLKENYRHLYWQLDIMQRDIGIKRCNGCGHWINYEHMRCPDPECRHRNYNSVDYKFLRNDP